MANTIQILKDGQPVYPITDVSLVIGLEDAIKLPPVKVTTLPTASAETAGKMYYVGPDANDEYERYITSAVNGSYEWIDLGDTSIPLPSIADNLTTDDSNMALSAKQGVVLDGKLSQLSQKVDVPTTTALDFSFNGYIKTDGSFTGTTNFKSTDYVAVRPGDVVVYTLAQGTSLPIISAYDSNKTFLQALAWGTNNFQTDATLTIPTSPAGIAFIRVSGRSINHDTHPQANPSGTITTYDKVVHESQLDAYKAEVEAKFDLVDEYGVYSGANGYIRKDTMLFSTSNNYRVSPLIPIYPGFVIEHNGTYNAPYSTVCNAFFGADAVLPTDKPMAVASFTGGKMTVTQADWDAGYRFVAISYDINSTPSPSATVSRTMAQDIARTDALVEELNNDTVGITRSSATVFNVIVPTGNGNTVRFPFERISKTWSSLTYQDADGNTQTISDFKSADVWNNFYVYDAKTGDYLCQGNSNFIYKATDEQNHAGNGHGCEVMDYFVSLIDGIEVTPTDSPTSYRCKEFRLIWRSKVFKSNGTGNTHSTTYPFFDTSGNPIVTAEHYIDITFKPGKPVKIINQLVIKREGVQFEQCHGAMLECNYGDFSKVICNDSNADYNNVSDSGVFTAVGDSVVLSNTTKKCNDVTMFGKGFYVRQKMVAVKANPENLVVRFTYYEDRLKCYFMPVICTTYSADAGLSPAQTFNTGDIIKVEDEREIVIF